jgi:cytochrome c oxidase subunit 2
VRLELASTDVIHSFWAPSLTGKMDLIPGRTNTLDLIAERAGVYAGQCAEFCGLQHAHMGVLVVAEPRPAFDAWMERQLRPAAEPEDDLAKRGRDLFVNRACMMCHGVRGTPAAARTGPDLTHLASRRFIAAGVLPNDPASLRAWIADPQAIKPGSNMPKVELAPDELDALVAYLGTLE